MRTDNGIPMKRLLIAAALLTVAALVFFAGCKQDAPPSLYSGAGGGGPAPTITAINPPGVALAGVTVMTIDGTNFSPVKEYNQVMFDATPGTVLTATASQLTVVPPILVKDTVMVKISVQGSSLFSAARQYKLAAAVAEFGVVPNVSEDPYGIACDTAGNVYVSLVLTVNGTGVGIKKITPAGVRSDFSTTPGVTKWSGLKVGPGGVLYAARSLPVIYKIPPTGGAAAIWVAPSSGIGRVDDFDFDAAGNVWAGGSGTKIYRVKPDGTVKGFDYVGNVRTLRVFSGALYAGGNNGTIEGVWRFPIVSTDSLGPPTLYFDNSAKYAPASPAVTALTFSSDGDMYMATDAADGILVVKSGGSSLPLYPGLISPTTLAVTWGKGSDMFVSRQGSAAHRIIRVNTLKLSAPYYGRQ